MASSSYVPPTFPSPGRFVVYHQYEDGKDWPALILDVKDEGPVGGPTTTLCQLQVFRAFGNHFRWVPEGSDWAHWSWPALNFSELDKAVVALRIEGSDASA